MKKFKPVIWCYKGFFSLTDSKIIFDGIRNVFKFYLQPVEVRTFNKEIITPHSRLIPTHVKVEVWDRDKGQCVICH